MHNDTRPTERRKHKARQYHVIVSSAPSLPLMKGTRTCDDNDLVLDTGIVLKKNIVGYMCHSAERMGVVGIEGGVSITHY